MNLVNRIFDNNTVTSCILSLPVLADGFRRFIQPLASSGRTVAEWRQFSERAAKQVKIPMKL
jgi:hypothetical protein